MIYIASPYSDPDPKVRQQRYEIVRNLCGIYINRGLVIYSPIVHNHPIAETCELPRGFGFWQYFDLHILNLCEGLTVLCIPGWEDSKGVQAEISFARNKMKDMPILYVDENGVDIYKAKKEPKYSYRRKRK